MKLLIIAPYFFEKHRWMISAYKTAIHLSKTMDVVVLTTGKPSYEEIHPRLRVYRCRDLFMPDPINYSIVPGLFFKLQQIIRREHPDVFLVNKHMFFTSLAVIYLRLIGKRVFLATDTFPGINWHPRNALVDVVMRVYAYLIGWPLLRLARQVILYHEGLIAVAKRLKLRYSVIHNGVDIAAVDAAIPATDIIHTDQRINVAYVGRLESIKGYYDFVSAAHALVVEYPTVHFYLIGNKDDKEEYVHMSQHPQIHFLGHRDDVYSVMKQMDIFVLPSYAEGLPNALMEAMAAGCACISTAVGGAQHLITHDKNGLHFTPGDVGTLQQHIVRLAEDSALRKQFAERGRVLIEREYDWRVIRDQYIKIFTNAD